MHEFEQRLGELILRSSCGQRTPDGGRVLPKYVYLGRAEADSWFEMVRSQRTIVDPTGKIKYFGERRFMGVKVIFTEEPTHFAVGD